MGRMSTLDSVVQVDPEILGGTPVFRGTRVPVKNLLDYLAAGDTLDQFIDDFPAVRREQAVAALELARDLLTAGAHSTAQKIPSAPVMRRVRAWRGSPGAR